MAGPDDPAEALPAEVLGRYRLGARLAAGSLGTVVAAVDERSGRAVAVKFFDGADDNYGAWVDEMRLAVRLEHPHIVPCLDAGHDPRWGMSVLVFAQALGGSLRRAMAVRRFAPAEVERLLAEVAAGLAHAHAHGVVHRDVKPENILALARPGEPPWALTDFGAGRFLARGATMRSLAGSLEYMAPEVFTSGADAACDQFSLGVVGLELLMGERLGQAGRTRFRLDQRGRPGLRGAIARLLDPDPAARFPSSEALCRALAAPQGRFAVARGPDGAGWLLAGDEVSRCEPGGTRPARVARVPRAQGFVHEADEAMMVAGDRRVVCLADAPVTVLAGDLEFTTFVASRRHRAIWLLRGDELACGDLAGGLLRLRVALPAAWLQALAEAAAPVGATLSPGLAALGLLGCATVLLARRDAQGLGATLLRLPGPLHHLRRFDAAVLLVCGNEREAALLRVEPGGLIGLERLPLPVDTVRIVAGPDGPRLASLLHPDHEVLERDRDHG